MSSVESLFSCTTPVQTARVFNPTRPEYYRADEAPKTPPEPAVRVTLSDEAKTALNPPVNQD